MRNAFFGQQECGVSRGRVGVEMVPRWRFCFRNGNGVGCVGVAEVGNAVTSIAVGQIGVVAPGTDAVA